MRIILHNENDNCFYIIITSSSDGRQQARESLGGMAENGAMCG